GGDERLGGVGVRVVHHALVATALQAKDHVRAHPPEPDHSQLHEPDPNGSRTSGGGSVRVSATGVLPARTGKSGGPRGRPGPAGRLSSPKPVPAAWRPPDGRLSLAARGTEMPHDVTTR